ncbi:MAG: hypothetical protein LUQ38_01015 [Methanotrichaceae archaeon]|nr:hypothetical protein [Methanotrichaceae archaeon]
MAVVAAILVIPTVAEIDGNIKQVDWAAAGVSDACPPIDYKPAITIMNTGDEKARFYVAISFTEALGKERQSGCLPTQEIEPGNTTLVWPYPIKLREKYNHVGVTLYAYSCLESHILDIDSHTVELKSCQS